MRDFLAILKPGNLDWDLATAIDPERMPAHVAIIMDGNGRWAGNRSLPRVAGHRAGIDPVRACVEACARMGVQVLTLYAFSVENWKRPRSEVETLWRLLRVYLNKELPKLISNGIRLNAIGRLDQLPAVVQRDLAEAIRATAAGSRMQVNLAINYGGRAEIVDAMNRLLDRARREGALESLHVTEEALSGALYTGGQPDPDLLIRTSGEMRVSNFLLWQIAYAELYVTDTLWPDFTRTDLLRAILEYQKRDRRFGGLTGSAPAAAPVAHEELVGAAGVPAK